MHDVSGSGREGKPTRSSLTVAGLLLAMLAAAIGHSTWINFKYLSKPIVEWYSFRQTQTALTADYLIKNGFSLRYETPVAGEPWSIPFEFPIFQQLVAWVSQLFNTSLPSTGRAVCFVFFALSSVALFKIMRRLNLGIHSALVAQVFFWVLPVNIFWAGTFMMEYAALFFTLGFIYFALGLLQRNATRSDLIGVFVFLTLALLQKITTALPALAVVSGILVLHTFRLDDLRVRRKQVVGAILLLGVPFSLGYAWVKHTDVVKAQNAIGAFLTSEQLKTWNYGTLSQRLSAELWRGTVFEGAIVPLGGALILLACGVGFFLLDRRRAAVASVAAVLFLFPYLAFTNLYIRHDYYQAANNVYLSASLGICLAALPSFVGALTLRRSLLFLILVGIGAGSGLHSFYNGIFYKQKSLAIEFDSERILMLATFVKNNTPEDSYVVWYGCDWNSSGAFYSGRKSLTVPAYGNLEIETISDMEKYLSKRPSAIVICPFGKQEEVVRILKEKFPEMQPHTIRDCTVYMPASPAKVE